MKKIEIYKYIKIIILIFIIFLVVLLFFLGSKVIDEKNTPIYSTVEEMPDVETLINQLYGKFIKMEDSIDETYFKDIYIELKYGLYEGETSKKDFINSLISTTSQMMKYQNYRLIDENKQIEIKVICDSANQKLIGTYINGDTNYYGHYESQKALANYKKTEITQFNIDSSEINTLIQNNWNKDKLNIGKAENQVDNYIEYSEYGINIYEIDKKIFNIIFDFRYDSSIINGIEVGSDLENVIQVLGTPTFGSLDEEYIGYKGEELYIFFNKDDISIYPVEKEIQNINELVLKYEENNSIKKLISEATDLWENYEEYYYDEYTVDLSYPLQGIKFQFGVTDNHGIIIYNNFNGKILEEYTQEELSNLEIEIPPFIYFVNEDSVNEYEEERVFLNKSFGEGGDFENLEDWKYM